MVKKIVTFLIFILVFTSLIFSNPKEEIVKSNNKTALKLLDLLSKSSDDNVFISPFSINSALSIALLGANGKTEEEMLKALNINVSQEEYHKQFSEIEKAVTYLENKECTIKNANRLWIQKGHKFLKSFFDNVEKYYKGGVAWVDFINNLKESVNTINDWVEDKTNGKIKNLLKPVDVNKLVKIIITNAIYFKGTWKEEFKEENTVNKPFYLENGSETKTEMMFNSAHYMYTESKTCQILKLNYKCGEFSMVIFLPLKGKKLNNVIEELNNENIEKFLDSMSSHKVNVYIPKFKFEKRYYLKKYLEEMGMKTPFSEYYADFSKMTGKRDIFIDKVIHQAKIEVNEKGSEAAAATAVVGKLAMAAPGFPEKTISFNADHPFLFFIIHNYTGEIVFEGTFIKPE